MCANAKYRMSHLGSTLEYQVVDCGVDGHVFLSGFRVPRKTLRWRDQYEFFIAYRKLRERQSTKFQVGELSLSTSRREQRD
ncbi:hypothetical protein ONS96_012362 [Cadophora gregata f. sp. sojae]|nr:hypothetical protein ONS96_012362 [Cadophora gregata f. sp. sojae]